MLDNPSGITEELTQDLDTLCLSESNFEVDPSQILRETADKHKLKFNLIQWLAESPNRTLKSQRKQAIAPNLSKISDLPEIFPAVLLWAAIACARCLNTLLAFYGSSKFRQRFTS